MAESIQVSQHDAAMYWNSHLAGLVPCHFPRLGGKVAGPKKPMTMKVNLRQSGRLHHLCTLNAEALPATLRASWALVLRCYTGAGDVCFGYEETTPRLATRAPALADGVLGMPISRLSVDDEKSLADHVENAKGEYDRSLPFHENVPAGVARTVKGGGQPFNTILALRNSAKPKLSNGETLATRAVHLALPDDCRIRLLVKHLNGTTSLFLEWWSSDMTMQQAMGVASTVDKAITDILSSPSISAGDFNPFTEHHEKQILKWNSCSLEKVNRCIHEVIHDQVVRKPDAEAICAWDGSFTYRQLDQMSSRLALHLVDVGVGPEVRVPLCFDKSKWNIVAMIAVMKAGGAFVPLDPSHPIARLQGLSLTVGASILLCSRNHVERLTPISKSVFPIDEHSIENLPANLESGNSISHSKPNNAAYVIFTSGSTGEPKGTVLEHSAYCSSAAAHSVPMHIYEDTRALQFAAHTFDSSLAESLSPLMAGGCVCIPSEQARLNGIVEAINEMQVNHAILTPSFIKFIDPYEVPNLKTLVLAGEAMSQVHVETWSKRTLVNGYGPSESSVTAVVNSNVTAETDCKDIGFPVGAYCWVVNPDNHDRLVPPGCIGELVLEGHTLAREYLNSPEKTSEAFIYAPVWSRGKRPTGCPGRFYKTGDLVQYNSSQGSLRYVGRKDTQVKLHGQRVELGEIEHSLNTATNVKHGLVLLPKVGHCEKLIVSIFSLSDDLARDPVSNEGPLKLVNGSLTDYYVEGIREYLSASLPTYMVPTVWLCVESMPMLTSKKIDRKSVSIWVDGISEDIYSQVRGSRNLDTSVEIEDAPDIEVKLRHIWSRVLNIPQHRISLNQSFLRLGGDSITAMTCMSQCKKLGLGFTVQEVLRSKSIKELSTHAKIVAQTVEYNEEIDQHFELSPIQKYHFQVRQEGQGHFNQSFFLRLTRNIEEKDVRHAIRCVVKRHSMLRARFNKTGSSMQWQQRVTNNLSKSHRFRSHRLAYRDEAQSAIADSQTCLDAINGPLLAVDFFDVGGEEQLLSMTAHHLSIDLVSWRIILEDLEELLLNQVNPALVEKSTPFQIWTKLQNKQCQDLSLSYVMPTVEIPSADFDYWGMSNEVNTYGDAACEGFEIDTATTSLLLTECHSALRTEPIDLLISVLIRSFGQTFKDRSVPVIYNEGHGREPWDQSIDISRTVGWFTTVYPVFAPTSTSESLVELTKRVKDIRRRVPGNGRPYFASRFLTQNGSESFSHHAPMEVSFNYLGQYQQLERSDALLQPVDEMAGEAREADGTADYGKTTPRFGLFEISAVIAQGKLRFSFTFNRHMEHQNSIRQWVSNCQEELNRAPSEFVGIPSAPTLGDFPLLPSLTYESLNSMMSEKLPRIGITTIEEIEDVYPCSPIQQGLLLSRTKDDAFYAVHATYEVKSTGLHSVSVEKLALAWKQVVRRHPALRTVFVEDLSKGGLYDQVVLKIIEAEPARLRCSCDSDVTKLFEEQLAELDNDQPPRKFTICQTSTGRVFCRLELSHAIMDGTSISIIFQDLALAYGGRMKDEPGPLYSQFISYLQSQPSDAGIPFWLSYLKGVEPCNIPILNDGIRVEKGPRTVRLEFNDVDSLQDFCNSTGLTLPNAIHTAWALTLSCYTGTEDICFGYLSSERDAPIPRVDEAVGPFINMLACRVNVSSTTALLSVLDQVQKDYVDSLPHKHTSLAEVQHALELSDTALFNTCVSYRRLGSHETAEKLLISFDEHCPIHDPTEYPISVNIEVSDKEVAIDLDYWTDSISDEQGKNIAGTFIRSLENIIHNSHQTIGELDNISSRDYEQIWSWNSHIPESINSCVHEVVGQQAEGQPSAAAICAWDGNFTYSELDELATRLSEYLVALGVSPETFVPTCFDKSAYTVVSMLAVLKAGAACVPLDATHPKSALEIRVLDTEAQVVLASADRASTFEDMVPYVVPISAELMDQIPEYGCTPASAQPSDPAFVIFTSGSTGKPKGVVLEHRSMVTSAEAHGSALGVGPETRFLQFAAYTFDNSLEEMFTTLMRGGCVCVPSENDRLNNLADAINKLNANFIDLTPTVATFLKPSDVPKVKGMAVGGEAMTKQAQEIWGGAIPIHNQYGPSECSINCAHNGDTGHIDDISNIGRSVGSISWVVDSTDHNKLLPVGSVGELLVEGPILARGYLNDQEKTAQSFVENPSWVINDPNRRHNASVRRMYKTGDLVRYNSNGTMCYLGRKDTQVKLNGQRIELGEIEHHVKSNLPATIQSAVQLVTIGGHKSLAVFLCLQQDGTVSNANSDDFLLPMSSSAASMAKELKSMISIVLPSYMVPAMYVPILRMPLTSSGKLDRRMLVNTAQSLSDEQSVAYRLGGVGGRAPATEAEQVLQRLWATILSKPVNLIGADDSFFSHGGNSIGAMKLVSAARSEGVQLTVAKVFQSPKLSGMAAGCNILPQDSLGKFNLSSKKSQIKPFELLPGNTSVNSLINEVSNICNIATNSVHDIYPCTSMQQGLIALSSKQPGAYVAQTTFRLPSNIDVGRFRNAWQAVADAEVALRTRIVFTEKLGFLQVVTKDPIEWQSISSLQDIHDHHRCIPKHDGDVLCRYTISGEGTSSPHFIWTAHHAIYDGWSFPTLLERVASRYQNPKQEEINPETSFTEFIEYLSSVDSKASDEFWKFRLKDPLSPIFPSLPSPSYQAEATSKVSRLARIPKSHSMDTTLATILRAAWSLTISLYSYSQDVIFGEIVTGRDAPVPGIENMIGPTLASIPTRVCIDRNLTVSEFLLDVQQQLSEAMPYQFAGLQHIKRLNSDTSIACEFQNTLTISQDTDETADGFWDMISSGTTGSNFFTYPLNLSCTIREAGVNLEAHYDQNVISRWQVEKLVVQLEVIFSRLVSDEGSQERIGDINLVGSQDLEELGKLNKHGANLVDRCIHDIVRDQVESDPDGMAICSWDASLSYKELEALSTKLAFHLISLGVSSNSETFVPLCFEKSAFTVIAMLAVLKAGGAFILLDPEHPVSRLRGIASDVGAFLILCSPKHEELCKFIAPEILAIHLDMLQQLPVQLSPIEPVPSNNVAYIIFTSGTTGTPKGTLIEHTAFASSCAAHAPVFRMKPKTRFLQFASYTFDACIVEMLSTLMTGGCICIPNDLDRMNDIQGFVNRMNVESACLTPSFAQLLNPDEMPSLKTLILAGEAMSKNHVSTWADRLNLINGYGPSECSVSAVINSNMNVDTHPTNIGRPLDRCWIVDAHNHDRLVPIGAVGELLVEGVTLSRGYLNNRERTAEVFIKSPKWAVRQNGSLERKMYKTGDLVKYSGDGSMSMMFMGRKDTQTKVRGQRLELDEVEHYLNADVDVQQAFAAVPDTGFAAKKLTAIVSLHNLMAPVKSLAGLEIINNPEAISKSSAIRERLQAQIPAYMVPSKWIVLSTLPLLASGKLDRRQMKEFIGKLEHQPQAVPDSPKFEYNMDNTSQIDIPEQLRKIWSKILNLSIEEVNLHSSFLHLGGDSISAMQVMARCRSHGLGVTVQNIIQSKSISELATHVTLPKKVIYKAEDGRPFNLSPIQQFYLENVGNRWKQFNQSILLTLTTEKGPGTISRAINELVDFHSMLRIRFQRSKNGNWTQYITRDVSGSIRFRVHNNIDAVDFGPRIEDSQKCLDIENGPIIAVDLFNLAGIESRVSIVIHHLVVDVVSWRIILQDLEDILAGRSLRKKSSLSFQDWCRLQAENAIQDCGERVLPGTEIPSPDMDYWGMTGQDNLFGDVLTEERELNQQTTTQFLETCHRFLQADPVDVLVASVLLSFRHEFTDRQHSPTIYNEGHGREPWDPDLDLSSIVGWFTTLSPIHLPSNSKCQGDDDLLDTIHWVQEFRNRTPGKGRPYFAYRQLAKDGKKRFQCHWPMEVALNYLGQMQNSGQKGDLLQPVNGGQSVNGLSDIGPEVPRFALIEISALITDGKMKLSFSYNKHMKRHDSIRNWSSGCKALLEEVPRRLKQQGMVTKQFPLLPLTYGGLSKVERQLQVLGLTFEHLEDVYACSPVQQGILISQLKDPEKYSYHSIFEVWPNRSNHRLDVSCLGAAWQSVVSRHSSLRTVFIDSISGQGLMDQLVLKQFQARVLFRKSTVDRVQDILASLDPLDYSEKQPPHRFTICQIPDGRVFCKLEISHAISDGSSMMLILEDLSKAYKSGSNICAGPRYRDFIAHLQSAPKENSMNYWKSFLSGIEPCIMPSLANITTNRKVGTHVIRIDRIAQLQSFCAEKGVTPSNVLQLVWGLVLSIYTGSSEVCFGYVTSGRDLPVRDIHEAVGAFINILICRLDLSDNVLLRNVLQKTQNDYMKGIENQNCSLAEVQHELGLADTSLFNTVFTFQKRSVVDKQENPGLSFESLDATDPNEFNISVNIAALDSHLEVDFGYWSDTLSDPNAENIAKTFEQVLDDIVVKGSDRTIGDIDFLDLHSCEQIRSWNYQPPKVVNKCVHEVIEQNVLLRPRSTLAVCAWDASFTYTELDTVASHLATYLTRLGIGPDVYVPLCFEKSAWAIVAQLGVLKAGGAFVPLDPAHPENRLRNIIQDVGADLVLCSSRYREKTSKVSKALFAVDSETICQLSKHPATPQSTSPVPSNAAYIIFTSGTTGRPKGTVIEHTSICTGALAHGEALLMHSSSRVLQFASYTFDASVTEILTALMIGACICVPSEEDRMNDLTTVISNLNVNWALLTPSVLGTLKPERLPSLKTIVTGGEAMSERIIKDWTGGPAVVNAYGPTEASVVASANLKVDENGISRNRNRSNIGTGTGCRLWIVDPRNYNRLMPVGAVGELVVEGRTVARGYLNNPQKTAEVFIRKPEFASHPKLLGIFPNSQRMYCTGDLVRYNPDGTMNYISRKDTQIKLNGQRIELGEIEYHCKNNLPCQTQVGVDLVVPSDRSKKTLAVFFSSPPADGSQCALPKAGDGIDPEILLPMTDPLRSVAKSLETALGSAIPTYMIPHLFIPVKRLPWSTAGKLDYNRLRNIVQALPKESVKSFRLTGVSTTRPAVSDLERSLQRIWESVFGLPEFSVTVSDSFFRLGGDSLAAIQLTGVARTRGISLTFANIFKHPVLSDMAGTCDNVKTESQEGTSPFSLLVGPEPVDHIKAEVSELCHVDGHNICDVYPCSSLQEGLIALSTKQPGAYIAQHIFKLSPNVNIDKFKCSWQEVVNNLDTLRTHIVHTVSSGFVQVVLKEQSILWNSATILNGISDETTRIPPYNGGNLTKYTIVEDDYSGSRYFVWCIHHALYDGWSLPLILKRVEGVYFGQPLTLPQISYAKFIRYLSTNLLQGCDEFWKSNLSGISSVNFPQVPHSMTQGRSEARTFSHSIDISKRPTPGDITIPTLIRAAWAMVIGSHSASDDICFGETLTGRNIDLPFIGDIVGPTLTTVPVRIRINRQGTVKSLLEAIQNMSADIVQYQHVGLHHIKQLDEDTSAACDFQNLLMIQTDQENDHCRDDLWNIQDSGSSQNFFTYPLVLECRVSRLAIETVVYHDENIIGNWQVQRAMDQFGFVISQLFAASQSTKISEIELLSPEDRESITLWNGRKPIIVNECIHDSFIRKANSQPNAPAVCDYEVEITYEELVDYASRLALHLTNFGIGAEDLVPICLEKSAWMVVGVMAVLFAGAAFVPLDPFHPASRHHEIIEETEAKIAICSPNYYDRFRHIVDHVVTVDNKTAINLPPSYSSTRGRAQPNNAAYTIFTSGTTGRAKGIVTEHRAFNSCSASFAAEILLYPHSRVLQMGSLSFDVSVMEILSTLTTGGCVCVPTEKERLEDIAGAIRRMNVTWALLTPSVANIVDPETVPCLETLACGGEALSLEVVSKWSDKVRLLNAYGPSEASVMVVINSKMTLEKDHSCIGHGIPAALTWILDPNDHNKLAPVGAVGELAIDGPILAREYLKNPQKTAEGFIESPYWEAQFPTGTSAKRRIYKTGDLVKYNTNGSINFIDRKDNQVKLNGQRMELGEVEHRLRCDPRIRHILVLMPKSGPCKKRLTAVLSLNNISLEPSKASGDALELISDISLMKKSRTQANEIRNSLSDQLPPFMVPQTWAIVRSIPLLVSGKLDRKETIGWLENVDDRTYQHILGSGYGNDASSRTTGIARVMQEIWSMVLNIPIEMVTVDQPFIRLGGDSITAMAVVSRCRKENINLSLHEVLRSKSISHLVARVGGGVVTSQAQDTTNEPFDLLPIQRLYMHSATEYHGYSRFNQSFSLRITKKTHPGDIESALQTIIDQHSMLRARFSKGPGGFWQQRIITEINTSYRYRIHQLNGMDNIPALVEQTQMCLNIEQGPIIAADLFNVDGGGQLIFLVAHHLCVDMVSWRIILQDLQEYLETGTLSVDRPLSFQAWSAMQDEYNRREKHSISLPFEVKRPNLTYWGMENKRNTYSDVDCQTFTINKQITNVALQGCHHAFQTEPIDLFLCSIAHSFSRVFADREIPTLFNEGHGRESWDSNLDLSRTVGWFTTLCPLHVPVDSDKDDVSDTLRRIKDTRRRISDNGRPYFAQRLSSKSVPCVGDNLPMEIVFNYLGRMQQFEHADSILQQTDIITNKDDIQITGDVGPDTIRLALFEVSAIILQGQLQFTFIFNRGMRRSQDICRWVTECKRTLEETIQTISCATAEPTLSDFPLLPISYPALKKLVKITFPKAGVTHRDQVEDIYPCSSMQEGILLSQLRDPNKYLFNVIFEVKLKQGWRQVDVERMGKAWQRVVDRHAALRTVFVDSLCRGGTFDQLVMKKVDSGVIFINCSDIEAIDKLDAIKLRDIASKKCPKLPHQFTICKTSSNKVIVKVEIDHAVIDGGSIPILVRDLIAAYDNQLPGGTGPLYSEYINFIKNQSREGEVEFWKAYLKGLRPCYLSQFSNQPTTVKRLISTHVKFNHYPELQALCDKTKVTLANVMHGAWGLVLRKYTRSDDVCFGYLSAGRDAPVNGIQDTIGTFINMLCCRIKFSPVTSLLQVIQKVQDDYLDSLPHQHCSLAQVQHELGLAGKALYNTALSIQNHSKSSDAATEEILFEPLTAHDPSEYAITVNIETARHDEGVVLRYWNDVMCEAEAQTLANAMADALSTILHEPEQRVADTFTSNKPIPGDSCEPLKQVGLAPSNDQTKAMDVQSSTYPVNDVSGQIDAQPLITNNSDLRKLVGTCVQDILQQMSKTGTLVTHNPEDITSLANHGIAKTLAHNQDDSAKHAVAKHHFRNNREQETALPQLQIQASPSTSEVYSIPEYSPRATLYGHSMASHINRRGRSAHVERKLLILWSSILEMEEDTISGEDNFFELGGDSLTAMKLVGEARDDGLALTVADVFRNPVFEDMVAMIRVASMMSTYIETDDMTDFNVQSQAIRAVATSEVYQRFALVNAPNVDAFLQRNICPKVGVFKGGIADVLPVTDFQALAITGSLLESRWMVNYLFLEGHGSLDFKMFKRSCLCLVQAVDILRTVFLPCGDRFVQVVLRKMRPVFFVYETDSDLNDFTLMLQERDRKQGPQLGEPFVNFTIVRQRNTDKHRIIIRMSHAQYDGVCLPRIIEVIKSGYENTTLPSMSSFASYVRASAGTITPDHYEHWRKLLKGSSMTEIVRRDGPNYRRSSGSTSQLKQSVLLSSIAHGSITTATIIKAAWSFVLAQLSGNPDVVFGHTISGRNATVPGIESTVGPCLNIIPVRVQFGDNWTTLDLLRYIQDQQVMNMPYEALGFREITRHCTEWPDWTNFTSIVQHQNVSHGDDLQLGRNMYKIGIIGVEEGFADFSVVSRPLNADQCEIALEFSLNGVITPIFAQKVLNMLCNTISSFMENQSTPLLSSDQLSELPVQTIDDNNNPSAGYFLSSQLRGLSRAEMLVLSDILGRAWREVLGEENTRELSLESSFFGLNGDVMGLAQVSWLLEQEGFKVRVEDLIDHPTMLGQMAAMYFQATPETSKHASASPSETPVEEETEQPPVQKSEKANPWNKALSMARRIARRNTQPA